LYAVAGRGLPLLKRPDGLRGALESDAAEQRDVLLGRLGGHRKDWEKQAASPTDPREPG
jgi:hypothetical protein